MNNVDPKELDQLNQLATERFELEVKLNQKNQEFKRQQQAANARHSAEITPIKQQINQVDVQISSLVENDRKTLLQKGRKSFATMHAVFQLRTVSTKLKIIDPDGLMAEARRLGIVRKIAKLHVVWKPNVQLFTDFITRCHEYRAELEDFFDDPSSDESLTIKPNGSHTVTYDGKRISPPSIKIK